MHGVISLIGAVLIIALAAVISLHTDTKKMQKINFIFLLIVVISGLFFYSFGLNKPDGTDGQAVLNALKTVGYTISMFTGGEKFDELLKANNWFSQNVLWQILFWVAHLLAVFVFTSTVLITWGKKLLNAFKLLLPQKNLILLYCENEDKFKYLSELEKEENSRVIYIGSFSKKLSDQLAEYTVSYENRNEIDDQGKWLKSYLLFKKQNKKISVIFVSNEDEAAIPVLTKILNSFTALDLHSENIRIKLLAENPGNYDFISKYKDSSSHSYITEVYTVSELVAHKLMLSAMPYKTMEFDNETCQAKSNFRAMVIGFGDVGQDCLRYLVRYGQFLNSSFSAEVFDTQVDHVSGLFNEIYADMLERYHIQLHNTSGFSKEIYQYFQENKKVNYIVVCCGKEKVNQEIINQLFTYRRLHPEYFAENMIIASCSKDSMEIIEKEKVTSLKPMDMHHLLKDSADMQARHLNDISYREKVESNENRPVQESELLDNWYRKDPLDRLSSISSAEFIPTFFACSNSFGLSRKETEEKIETKLIQILPELEHLRWNAFESSMGIISMSKEEFTENVNKCISLTETALRSKAEADYQAAKKQFSITRKDLNSFGIGGRHVCLTDWGALDELWEIYLPLIKKYNLLLEANGQKQLRLTTFKELDEKNIYHMLDILND